MNEVELQAAQAQALRQWATDNDSPLLAEFADAIEVNLSRDLEARHSASQLTREQTDTLAYLIADYDSVELDGFLPDGTALAKCFNYSETDGEPVLQAVVHIEPGGVPT